MTTPGRPRVAIAPCRMARDPGRNLFKGKELHYTEAEMSLALWRAGALPLTLPLLEPPPEPADELLTGCSGLLLQGGDDVSPLHYGETPRRPEWAGDLGRDRLELALLAAARRRGLPILGICRGHQLLNVGLGGSLWQDLVTDRERSQVHRDPVPYDRLTHEVELLGPSVIADCYAPARRLTVNTVHHQGVRVLAEALRATAVADDGTIEAFEAVDQRQWIVGVQWHPEWLGPDRPADTVDGGPIFRAFVERCAQVGPARPRS